MRGKKTALDVACGSRMIWFDSYNPQALFLDNRTVAIELCDGRRFEVAPDVIADFRDLPFRAASFPLVVFDPPHLRQAGDDSWLAIKYGRLKSSWREDLTRGFAECFRVLMPLGTLVFKWSERHIKTSDVLPLALPHKPLFGNRRGSTIWCIFQKQRFFERRI